VLNLLKHQSGATCFTRLVIIVITYCITFSQVGYAESLIMQPKMLPKASGAEFYSNSPGERVLMPVSIWGEVYRSGIHYIPENITINHALSLAGGPNGAANLAAVTLTRSGKILEIDIRKQGFEFKMQKNDAIFVERSLKADLPLIFSAVATVMSVTLFAMTLSKND
jgi:hypothetical protein